MVGCALEVGELTLEAVEEGPLLLEIGERSSFSRACRLFLRLQFLLLFLLDLRLVSSSLEHNKLCLEPLQHGLLLMERGQLSLLIHVRPWTFLNAPFRLLGGSPEYGKLSRKRLKHGLLLLKILNILVRR